MGDTEDIKLQVDDSHKKVKFGKSKIGKKIVINTLIGAISLLLCTGCNNAKGEQSHISEEEITTNSELKLSQEELDTLTTSNITQDGEKLYIAQEEKTINHERDSFILDIYSFDPNQIIEIKSKPVSCRDRDGNIIEINDKMTIKELQQIESILNINSNEGADYSWLNYCTNLKSIGITSHDGMESLKNIHGKNLKNLQSINVTCIEGELIDSENCFIYEVDSLRELKTYLKTNLNLELLDKMSYLESLSLSIDSFCNYDFNTLKNIKKLEITGKPYDIAIYLSNKDIENLRDRGIDLSIENYEKVKQINQKLDSIVDELNISEDASEQEKLNKILLYVLQSSKYNQDVKDNKFSVEERNDIFYLEGLLYGALENDTQICGNYAALTQALAKRVGLKSWNIESPTHAYNLIKEDDIYYLVDSTWLDEQNIYMMVSDGEQSSLNEEQIGFEIMEPKSAEEILRDGEQSTIERLTWYHEDPKKITDEAHQAYNFPEEIDLEYNSERIENEKISNYEYSTPTNEEVVPTNNQLDEDNEASSDEVMVDSRDVSNQEFNVFVDGKKFIIPGGVLIGILAGLGIAKIASDKKRERQRRERRRREQRRMFDERDF